MRRPVGWPAAHYSFYRFHGNHKNRLILPRFCSSSSRIRPLVSGGALGMPRLRRAPEGVSGRLSIAGWVRRGRHRLNLDHRHKIPVRGSRTKWLGLLSLGDSGKHDRASYGHVDEGMRAARGEDVTKTVDERRSWLLGEGPLEGLARCENSIETLCLASFAANAFPLSRSTQPGNSTSCMESGPSRLRNLSARAPPQAVAPTFRVSYSPGIQVPALFGFGFHEMG